MTTAGTQIGARYRLEHVLGEGGMGVVWAAEDAVSGERCAIKLMKDAPGDPEARRRFLREARAASAVRHPSVVTILEVLDLEGRSPAIVMELLTGESLRDVLARGRLGIHEVADILVPVISAVGTAHALGVVHRDLKPENIFLAHGPAGERVVKVLDFGIAKLTALDGDAVRSTGVTTGAVLGTPAYMAPEQVFAERDIDHRADTWALGLILYQCLSGVLPTAGDNVGQVLKHVLSRPFEPLEQLVPELPADIAHLVARMLSRERAERPADLREVATVLEPHASAPAVAFGAPQPSLAALSIGDAADPLAATAPTPPALRDAAVRGMPTARTRGRTRRNRLALVLAIGAALALLGLEGVRWLQEDSTDSQDSRVSPASQLGPLAAASAKLACPVLRVSGVEAPSGWLGAAAASIACERARVILGGRPERTLVPAELLDLPGFLTRALPKDVYDEPDAIQRSMVAARQRAQAYFDGEVSAAAGFTVALSLHRADGVPLGPASSGRGAGLYEAVRSAMAPWIRADLVPKAPALDPDIAAWARTDSVDDALGVVDLTFAFAQNAGRLPEECSGFDALSDRVRELGAEGRWQCAMTLAQALPNSAPLVRSDRSAAAIATRIRVGHEIAPADPPEPADLESLFRREPTARGKSLLAITQSCLLEGRDPEAATEWAIRAVESDPKNFEGGLCTPWGQLKTLQGNSPGALATTYGMQAWQPWNSYAWLPLGFRTGNELRLLRRARLLSPFDAYLADIAAASFLAAGDQEAARSVEADLRRGGLPLHQVEGELLHIRIETSLAHFGEALRRAQAASGTSASDFGWIRVQRFNIAWHAFELAVLLDPTPRDSLPLGDRARKIADALIESFVDSDPPVLESNFEDAPMRVTAICARSSAPRHCFTRFRSLRAHLSGAITHDTDALLAGAEHYARGNIAEAAKAWRPLVAGSMALASAMPAEMADAFNRTGATELADRVDQEVMKRALEFHGATLGHVRQLRRARNRRDLVRAHELITTIINAWGTADEPPPALAEVRKLRDQLSPR